jgi:hypothetical protein
MMAKRAEGTTLYVARHTLPARRFKCGQGTYHYWIIPRKCQIDTHDKVNFILGEYSINWYGKMVMNSEQRRDVAAYLKVSYCLVFSCTEWEQRGQIWRLAVGISVTSYSYFYKVPGSNLGWATRCSHLTKITQTLWEKQMKSQSEGSGPFCICAVCLSCSVVVSTPSLSASWKLPSADSEIIYLMPSLLFVVRSQHRTTRMTVLKASGYRQWDMSLRDLFVPLHSSVLFKPEPPTANISIIYWLVRTWLVIGSKHLATSCTLEFSV